MKRRMLAAVIGLGLLSIASSAMAQGLTTISVSAQIPAKCAVDSVVAQTAAFGDVITTPPAGPITVTPLFRCTKGTTITITDDGGLNGGTPGSFGYVKDAGVNKIQYTYTYTAPATGTGWGAANQLSMPIAITLVATGATGYETAPSAGAGTNTYNDTLTFTIVP